MAKSPDVYLELALRALQRVPKFLRGRSLEAYLADEICQAAVERQLEIAGDALGQLRRLAPPVFGRIPDGPLIVAFRNGSHTATPRSITSGCTTRRRTRPMG